MQQAEQELGAAQRDCQLLLEKLQAAEQVRLEVEGQREALQRQLAVVEGRLVNSEARLHEAHQDDQGLSHKLTLEASRCCILSLITFSFHSDGL